MIFHSQDSTMNVVRYIDLYFGFGSLCLNRLPMQQLVELEQHRQGYADGNGTKAKSKCSYLPTLLHNFVKADRCLELSDDKRSLSSFHVVFVQSARYTYTNKQKRAAIFNLTTK